MSNRIIKPNDVSAFIRGNLKKQLQNDFSGPIFRIFRERDLHACSYYHLRNYLKSNKHWEILNEPLCRGLKGRKKGAHPDIAILRKGKLVFLIELKFRQRHTGIQRKDQRILRKAVKHSQWAKKVYYIESIIQPLHKSHKHLPPYKSKIIRITMDDNRLSDYLKMFKKRRKPKSRKAMQRHLTSTQVD